MYNRKGGRRVKNTFKTTQKVTCLFTLPEFHQGKDIAFNIYVDKSDATLNSYDMIIGRYLLHELGIDLLFSLGVMKWDKVSYDHQCLLSPRRIPP